MFRARYETIEEREEKNNDTSWHHCHGFLEGYFWKRNSDSTRVLYSYLFEHDIVPTDFPNLGYEKIKEIVADIKEKNRIETEERIEYRKNNPLKPLTEIAFPLINKEFPPILISDLVGVQPMQNPNPNEVEDLGEPPFEGASVIWEFRLDD